MEDHTSSAPSCSTKFSSNAFKITCKFTPHCNTIFHNKCQIQTSVLMSRAIHEAISAWLFQDLSIVKKTCGDFGVLCMTRLPDIFAGVLVISKSVFNFVVKPSCYDIY